MTKRAAWLLGWVLASCGGEGPTPEQRAEAERLLERGKDAIRQNDYDAAEEWAERSIELDPTRADAHYALGIAHFQRAMRGFIGMPAVDAEFLETAREEFDRAIELDPSVYAYHLFAGRARQSAHRPEEAIPFLEEAVRLAPDDVESRFRLGVCLQVTERSEEARGVFQRVLERQPMHPKAWHHLGLVCQELGLWPESVKALEQAVVLAPEDPSPRFDLAQSLREVGRVDEAEAAQQRFLELHEAAQAAEHAAIRDSMEREAQQR